LPRTIDPIKKQRYKSARLKGKSKRESLRLAGYAKNTADHNITRDNKLLKTVSAEIKEEFKKESITVEFVLKGIRESIDLALKTNDIKALQNAYKLLGDYLKMFGSKDTKTIVNVNTEKNISKQIQDAIDRYQEIRGIKPYVVEQEGLE